MYVPNIVYDRIILKFTCSLSETQFWWGIPYFYLLSLATLIKIFLEMIMAALPQCWSLITRASIATYGWFYVILTTKWVGPMNSYFDHMEKLRYRIKNLLRITQLLSGKFYICFKVFKISKPTLTATVIYHLFLHYLNHWTHTRQLQRQQRDFCHWVLGVFGNFGNPKNPM